MIVESQLVAHNNREQAAERENNEDTEKEPEKK